MGGRQKREERSASQDVLENGKPFYTSKTQKKHRREERVGGFFLRMGGEGIRTWLSLGI